MRYEDCNLFDEWLRRVSKHLRDAKLAEDVTDLRSLTPDDLMSLYKHGHGPHESAILLYKQNVTVLTRPAIRRWGEL